MPGVNDVPKSIVWLIIVTILSLILSIVALIIAVKNAKTQGPTGLQGPQGPQGIQGPVGKSPPPNYSYVPFSNLTSVAPGSGEVQGSADEAANKCNEDEKCRGFTYDESRGKYALRYDVKDNTRVHCDVSMLYVKDDLINRNIAANTPSTGQQPSNFPPSKTTITPPPSPLLQIPPHQQQHPSLPFASILPHQQQSNPWPTPAGPYGYGPGPGPGVNTPPSFLPHPAQFPVNQNPMWHAQGPSPSPPMMRPPFGPRPPGMMF